MNTIKAIMSRKSVRSYKPAQIRNDDLEVILHSGMAAPVGSNAYDSLHITVVQNQIVFQEINDAVAELMYKITGRQVEKNFGAPTMIFVSSKPAMMSGIEYANAACVLENMAIAATSLGIDNIIWGGAALAVAQSKELSEKLQIPKEYNPMLCISLGYAKEIEYPKKHTISFNQIV